MPGVQMLVMCHHRDCRRRGGEGEKGHRAWGTGQGAQGTGHGAQGRGRGGMGPEELIKMIVINRIISIMKTSNRLFFVLITVLFTANLNGQKPNPEYDSTLARKLGADERGMKSYVFVILKSGPNKMEAGAARDSLFAGHFSNMNRMAEDGKLVIAGPMGTNDKSYRGIFILNVKTIDEAKILLQNDPTVREKIFDTELYEWYGSAAISEYLKVVKKIEKTIN